MYTTSLLYPIISRVAAVVLLTAGGLKLQEVASVTASLASIPWADFMLAGFELLFGLWLLIGLFPRWSRLIALVCFTVFLNVSLFGALQGHASCGCFGKVPVRPWSAVTLDALMVGAFLFSPVVQLSETAPQRARIRWLAFAVSAALMLLLIGWPLAMRLVRETKAIPSQTDDDLTAGTDATALERVIQGVERNHAALHTLVYTKERTQTQHAVKDPYRFSRPVWKDGKVLTGSEAKAIIATLPEPELKEKISRGVFKTWIRGDEVRENGVDGAIMAGKKGKRIQYSPSVRQASISSAEFLDEDYSEALDLRCAGLAPPLRSIADWLRRCEVLSARLTKGRNGQEAIRVHARMKKYQGKYEEDVTADFSPALNCMPIRVVKRYLSDGSVSTVTDIDYQQVGTGGAWFPRQINDRSFYPNTTSDPDAPSGQYLSQQDTVTVLAVDQGVRDEDLDPILPANTRLLGDLTAKSYTGDAPVRASQVSRAEPRPITRITPFVQGESPTRQHPLRWPLATVIDFLLLGTCLRFRKRLAF